MISLAELHAWAVERHAALTAEIARIETALATYFSAASGAVAAPQFYAPVHYSESIETCECVLCRDWRVRRDEANRVSPFMEGHARDCACTQCRVGRQVRFGFLAATNRRDLWTETSYYVAVNKEFKKHGKQVLLALKSEIESPRRTTAWWAIEGGRYPLGFWWRKIHPDPKRLAELAA